MSRTDSRNTLRAMSAVDLTAALRRRRAAPRPRSRARTSGARHLLDEEILERVANRVERHERGAGRGELGQHPVGSGIDRQLDVVAAVADLHERCARATRAIGPARRSTPAATRSQPRTWNARMSVSRPVVTSRPRARMATRLQSASASLSTCELKKTVQPRSRSRRMSARTSRRPSGSRPDIGSSRITSSGSLMSAWAMPTRCSMPLENLRSCSRRSPRDPDFVEQPARARPAVGGAVAEQPGEVLEQLLGRQVVVEVRVLGQVADAVPDRRDRRAAGRAAPRWPEVGNTSCISSFSVVVLPAPLGPRKPKTSPGCDVERQAVERAVGSLLPEADRVVLGQIGGGQRVHGQRTAPGAGREGLLRCDSLELIGDGLVEQRRRQRALDLHAVDEEGWRRADAELAAIAQYRPSPARALSGTARRS